MNAKLSEEILGFLHQDSYKPVIAEELALQLEIRGQELSAFWQVLSQLEAEGALVRTPRGKYALPETLDYFTGKLALTSKGYGFVMNETENDLFIPPSALNDALNGDKVMAKIHRRNLGGKSFEGEIIRVLERARKDIVGTFERNRYFGFVTPDDKRLGADIFVPKEDFNKAQTGSKVVVEITKWPHRGKNAEGRIKEVLGYEGEKGVDVLAIIKDHSLPVEFPAQVKRAAKKIADFVSEADLTGRRDLRQQEIVTSDGDDAKDLDDAVNVAKLENGGYLLGVHIADVSYYVQEGSVLDKEAAARGTSVYLVDRVLPMLPERLSNGICSLNAGVDRLALSIEMETDRQGQVVKYEIFPSVIKIKRRLSYEIVRKILSGNDQELCREYQTLIPALQEMEKLCLILREKRLRRGAIDFNFPELKVHLDDNGQPVAVSKRERTIAESIIEEFMLIANETVAQHLSSLAIPAIYRIHEEPEEAKLANLQTLLNNFGHQTPLLRTSITPMVLQKILTKIADSPEERIVSSVMLRSLKQARYAAENSGHFGLAATYYTHFTSPIRRYPDLIVHRLLREGKMSEKRRQKLAALLPEIARHSSERERAAFEAERDTTDLKKAEYMTGFIGAEFEGVIVSVTAFGFFVEIENGIEGLVHIASLKDDYYQYVEEKYSLVGERTGKTYCLGDKAVIVVAGTNPEARTIDYVLSPNGTEPKTVKQKTSLKKETKNPTAKAKKGRIRKGKSSRR
ncbi:MAG: ribonuclease R [Sporomusaceae bacterium]|jgi:ribonuclease R|nr:ribonuclease R [Sporomusaceae bacterium]